MRNAEQESPKAVPQFVYEQWCEDFRAINAIFWRVPFIAITITGGILFAIGTFPITTNVQIVLLFFLGLSNLCFIIVIWRLRTGVMQPILNRINKFENRNDTSSSKTILIVFTILFGLTAGLCFYGGFHPEIFNKSKFESVQKGKG